MEQAKEGDDDEEEDDDQFYGDDLGVPFQEKIEFSDRLRHCDREGVTKVVEYLLEHLPHAVEKYGAHDKYQVRVDLIDRANMDSLKPIVKEFAAEGSAQKRRKRS